MRNVGYTPPAMVSSMIGRHVAIGLAPCVTPVGDERLARVYVCEAA